MIIDFENELSDAQAVTATAASTNFINFGDTRDHAAGNPLMLEIVVDTTATAAGAATVTFDIETDDNSSFSSATTLLSTGAIGKATLVAGYAVYRGAIPHGLEQYLRINYTVATGPLTAGAFSARIVEAFQTNVDG